MHCVFFVALCAAFVRAQMFHSDLFCGCDLCCNIVEIDRDTKGFTYSYIGPYDDPQFYDTILAENVTHHANIRLYAYQPVQCVLSEGFVFNQTGTLLHRVNLTQFDDNTCALQLDDQLTVQELNQPLLYYYALKALTGTLASPAAVDLDVVPVDSVAPLRGVGNTAFSVVSFNVTDNTVGVTLGRYHGYDACPFPASITMTIAQCAENATAIDAGGGLYEFTFADLLSCSVYFNGPRFLELRLVVTLEGDSPGCSASQLFFNPVTHKLRTTSTIVGSVISPNTDRVQLTMSETVGMRACNSLVPSAKAVLTMVSTSIAADAITNSETTVARIGNVPLVQGEVSCVTESNVRTCSHIFTTQSCLDVEQNDDQCAFLFFPPLSITQRVTYADQGAVAATLSGLHRYLPATQEYDRDECPVPTTAVDVSDNTTVVTEIIGGTQQVRDNLVTVGIGIVDTRPVSVIMDTAVVSVNGDTVLISLEDKLDNLKDNTSPYFSDVNFCSYFNSTSQTCEPFWNRTTPRWNSWVADRVNSNDKIQTCVDTIGTRYVDAFAFTPSNWFVNLQPDTVVNVRLFARIRSCTERFGRSLMNNEYITVAQSFTIRASETEPDTDTFVTNRDGAALAVGVGIGGAALVFAGFAIAASYRSIFVRHPSPEQLRRMRRAVRRAGARGPRRAL